MHSKVHLQCLRATGHEPLHDASDAFICSTCKCLRDKATRGFIPACTHCSTTGGFLMLLEGMKGFIHTICALYTPGCKISMTPYVSPVARLNHCVLAKLASHAVTKKVPAWQQDSICEVCNKVSGVCLRCSVAGWLSTFHPRCAHVNGHVLYFEVDDCGEGRPVVLCSSHSHLVVDSVAAAQHVRIKKARTLNRTKGSASSRGDGTRARITSAQRYVRRWW